MTGVDILEARLGTGMNQIEFAEAMGVSQPHLSRIESDRRNLYIGILEKVAAACGARLVCYFEAIDDEDDSDY